MASQFELLKTRRFGPFFGTQFLGAFNDNVFRNALLILIAYQGVGIAAGQINFYTNLSAALFTLPYFLFSATAGQLADKYDKSVLICYVKLAEIVIMAGAAVGLYLESVPLMLAVLFLTGTQSTVFGPVKYAIMPQHLHDDELMGGNGMVEMGTFLAILLGTIAGGVLIAAEGGTLVVGVAVILIAALGYLTSRAIPKAPAADPGLKVRWNLVAETWRSIQYTRESRPIFLSILGISWFWFYGTLVLVQIPNYTKEVLGGTEGVVTLLLALFSLGIGIGSVLCERMSGRMVELGLVPFGSIGMAIFGVDAAFAYTTPATPGTLIGVTAFLATPGAWRVVVDLTFFSIFTGFYIVPLYAVVQQRSRKSHLSRIIAGNNILNACFMVMASVMAIVLLGAGLTIPQLFLVAAVMNALVALYIYTLVPEFLMRFVVWILIHTIYRVDKEGLERIPDTGPALLVCNHVSFVDALIVGGCCRRPVRFVMDHHFFKLPILQFVFRTARAIPIAPAREDADLLRQAYEAIDQALADGDVVCIFPEGRITKDGEMNPFRPGVEKILRRRPVPVIPMALRGLWGSMFSRKYQGWKRLVPWRLRARIDLVVAPPVPAEAATAEALYSTVHVLRGNRR